MIWHAILFFLGSVCGMSATGFVIVWFSARNRMTPRPGAPRKP